MPEGAAPPNGASEFPLVSSDQEDRQPEPGWALCLSGGGYRAMLFHVGAFWRLNELGFLPRLDRISSVSGGSLTAGALGARWSELDFDSGGVARKLQQVLVAPVRRLAGETLDVKAILGGILTPGSSISDKVAKAYRKHLFGDRTLQDLPDRPRFVINATSVQTGALFRFSKPYLGDHKIGRFFNPPVPLASAVTASSAFPPVLSPVTLDFAEGNFKSDHPPGDRDNLSRPPFTRRVVLSDGGVYDNLGLETAWKRYTNVLVSDGGGQMQPEEEPAANWATHAVRINGIIDNQVRSLRKRQLVASYKRKERGGTYWGIRTHIQDYKLADALPAPDGKTLKLAETPTRLSALPADLQEKLINWGYAVCDAALRKHVLPGASAPASLPYPSVGVG